MSAANPHLARPGSIEGRRADLLIAAALFAFGAVLAWLTFRARDGRPTVHDEFAYLFQARTLLAGRVAFPSPPLPEFFESMHLLVVPTYSAKYFPGHALLLAPFVALGAPWLFSSVALGAATALLFSILRLAKAGLVASTAAALVFAASGRALFVWASYLSHPSAGLCGVLGFYCAARLWTKGSAGWAAGLGACAGFAALTRPYCGVALGAAGLFALLASGSNRQRWLAFGAPVLCAGLLGIGYCKATTGSFTTAPWSLYARQYTPADGPGIGPVGKVAPPERGLPPHLAQTGEVFEAGRRAYDLRAAVRKAERQVSQLEGFASSAFVVAFAGVGLVLLTAPLAAPVVFAAVLFTLQLGFHADPGYYLFEAWPAVALLAGWGLHRTLLAVGRLASRRKVFAARAALGAVGLWIAVVCEDGVAEVQSFGGTTAELYARVDRALQPARAQRSLVFIRYPEGWSGGVDLTQNEPDLARAQVVLANDRGADDARLVKLFPDRAAFRLELTGPKLVPLDAARTRSP